MFSSDFGDLCQKTWGVRVAHNQTEGHRYISVLKHECLLLSDSTFLNYYPITSPGSAVLSALIDFITGRVVRQVPALPSRAQDKYIKQKIMYNAFGNVSVRVSEVTNGRKPVEATQQFQIFDFYVPDSFCKVWFQHCLVACEHNLRTCVGIADPGCVQRCPEF